MSRSQEKKKKKIVNLMLSSIKDCYEGRLTNGICTKPIELILFKYDQCPSCDAHIPTLMHRIKQFKKYEIPISLTTYDIKEDQIKDLYTSSGCKGTPCVLMRDMSKPNILHKISEGIDQDIGFLSNLMDIQNPLFTKDKIIPKRLMQSEKSTKW